MKFIDKLALTLTLPLNDFDRGCLLAHRAAMISELYTPKGFHNWFTKKLWVLYLWINKNDGKITYAFLKECLNVLEEHKVVTNANKIINSAKQENIDL